MTASPDGWQPIAMRLERDDFFAIVQQRTHDWSWNCYLTEAKHRHLGHRARGRSKTASEACLRAEENMRALQAERAAYAAPYVPLPHHLGLAALRMLVDLRKKATDAAEIQALDEQRQRILEQMVAPKKKRR
jgi:hypothetical protein